MTVFLNGDERELPSGSSVSDLVDLLEIRGKRIAIELNGEIVSRKNFDLTILSPMDRIEIVHAIGGG